MNSLMMPLRLEGGRLRMPNESRFGALKKRDLSRLHLTQLGYQTKSRSSSVSCDGLAHAHQANRCHDQNKFLIANIGKMRSMIESDQDFLKTLLDKTGNDRHHSAHLKRASQHSSADANEAGIQTTL